MSNAKAEPTNIASDVSEDNNGAATTSKLPLWNAHMKSTAALCCCIASMAYMIISVFPYSGFMAIALVDGVTEETAGTYAGLLASSFMIGRVTTSYAWGKWADLYGRVFTLQVSLLLSSALSLMFGLAPTYGVALLVRFLLGVSNGIMSTSKTAVTELAHGDAKLEKRGMGLVVGMWGWGFLWSPAVGGFLAEPVRQYPNASWIQNSKLWTPILTKFPFLLPNMVGSGLCLLAVLAVHEWVPETLAQDKLRHYKHIPSDTATWIKGLLNKIYSACMSCCYFLSSARTRGTEEEQAQLLESPTAVCGDESFDNVDEWTLQDDGIQDLALNRTESANMLSTQVPLISPRPSIVVLKTSVAKRLSRMSALSVEEFDVMEEHQGQQRLSSVSQGTATMKSLWNRIDTRVHLILYWIFGFIQVTGDEAFPLYCISKRGGLGLSESSIGQILSLSGLMFGICQYFVYATIVNRLGLYESMVVGSLCLPVLALIPFATLFGSDENDNDGESELTWAGLLYLCLVLATSRIIASVFFSSIFIALNRTVPTSHRATMNGLQTLGGSVGKGLGPTFAGLLVAFSLSSGVFPDPRVGGFFIWFVVGILGILNTMAVTCMLKEENIDA